MAARSARGPVAMRVLLVSEHPHLPDIRGGLQTTTHDLCLAMQLAGAEAAVLCGLNKGDPSAWSQPMRGDESLGYLCLRAASIAQALPLAAAAWSPDIIVVQSSVSLTTMVLASLRTGRPTAVYLHNVEPHQLGGNLMPDPSLLYLSNSEFTARRWQALYGIHSAVIPPVVQADRYLTGSQAVGQHVLFVNPVPIKGVEILLALAAQCPDLSFLVVESWNLEPHWRAYCRERAQALRNVQWRSPTDDMREVYVQTRVLLMPSVWEESFGRTVVEAQINGIPVLASDRGALPQVVGQGGLTVSPERPVQVWEAALRQLLAQHEDYSAKARQIGLAHAASTPLIVAQMLGLLSQHTLRA